MRKSLLVNSAIAVICTGSAIAGGQGHFLVNTYTPVDQLPDAQAGQCFARIVIPAQYESVPETVIIQDAQEKLSAVEPQFASSSLEVKVKDEGVRYVVHQPVYETQTEQVLVKPGHERLVITPARYETVTETIQVSEARKVWKPGTNLSNTRKVDEATGQIYCLVEIPAETKTITRTVMVEPERVSRVAVDPVYTSVQTQRLVDRGGVEEIPTPAEFKSVPTQELVAPAYTSSQMIAPRTQTVERTVLRQPERFEWVEVLCDTNAHSSSVSDLQRGLRDHGYYNGPIDGILGSRTESAVRNFQQDQGLPHQGFVTMETLRRLQSGAQHNSTSYTPSSLNSSHNELMGGEQSLQHYPQPVYQKPLKKHVAKSSFLNSPKPSRVVDDRLNPDAWSNHSVQSPQKNENVILAEAYTPALDEAPELSEETTSYTEQAHALKSNEMTSETSHSVNLAKEFEAQAQKITQRNSTSLPSHITNFSDERVAMSLNGSRANYSETVVPEIQKTVSGEDLAPILSSKPADGQYSFQRPTEYSVRRPQSWEVD